MVTPQLFQIQIVLINFELLLCVISHRKYFKFLELQIGISSIHRFHSIHLLFWRWAFQEIAGTWTFLVIFLTIDITPKGNITIFSRFKKKKILIKMYQIWTLEKSFEHMNKCMKYIGVSFKLDLDMFILLWYWVFQNKV